MSNQSFNVDRDFFYDNFLSASEKVHGLFIQFGILIKDIDLLTREYEKLRAGEQNEINSAWLSQAKKKIESLENEQSNTAKKIHMIIGALPIDDIERRKIAQDDIIRTLDDGTIPDSLSIIPYTPFEPEDGCGESRKDQIFSKENMAVWVDFARQVPFIRLVNDIRRRTLTGKNSDCYWLSRQEARKIVINDPCCIFDYYHDTQASRFVECCFVTSYNYNPYEWISPKDILDAIEQHCIGPKIFDDRIREDCEGLWYANYLEKHPDDEPKTIKTRYRVNF